MNMTCKLTDKDIARLGDARQALREIDCSGIPCKVCPLNLTGDGCFKTLIDSILTITTSERRTINDN